MSDLLRLIEAGKALNLDGKDLESFIHTQQELNNEMEKERMNKEMEKERMNKEMEMEKEKIRMNNEMERDRMNKERDDRAAERELQKLKIEAEKDQMKLQLEIEKLKQQPQPEGNSLPQTKGLRLPCFDDRKDEIDCYLTRFERHAQISQWKEETWATHLGTLLTGKALETFTRLDANEALDYEIVKNALIKRFNLTEDGFASRFRSSRPESGESMGQFKNRLTGYLLKWLELAGKDKTKPDHIMDLIIKEQLMNSCNRDLMIFLKERKPSTADEVVDLVENYTYAHGSANAFSKANLGHVARHANNIPEKPPHQRSNIALDKTTLCHRCQKPGHLARDCRLKGQQTVRTETNCSYCKRRGHTLKDCWERQRKENSQDKSHYVSVLESTSSTPNHAHCPTELKCGCKIEMMSAACSTDAHSCPRMPVTSGLLNGKSVSVLRDSGCSVIVVRKGLVPEENRKNDAVTVYLADGSAKTASVTEANLTCPYFDGVVTAVEMDTPLYDVIVGNVPGAKCPGIDLNLISMVETRSARDKRTKPLATPVASTIDINPKDMAEKQGQDETLNQCHEMAKTGKIKNSGKSNQTWYSYEDGILVRHFKTEKLDFGEEVKQTVVPRELRPTVMGLAHESIMAGHLAAKKTTDRILQEFFWPNIWEDVRMFCQSCDTCQRSTPKGRTCKVPLEEVPLIDEPFKRIAVDIIGPIIPASARGNRYILTVVDYCTRYPEALPMKSIDTETVAEALVDIFSRVGIPQEILTDKGAQFTSELMTEICRLLSIRQLTTTPFHPQCNGLVEKFNGTLKAMLKRLASDKERDWDRYINAALFAYREAPQESLGFSPFELLFGRSLRGPLTILRELWTNEIKNEEVKSTYQYVVDLRHKMEQMISLAQDSLSCASSRYKAHYDRRAKPRSFQVGEQVLLLIPTKHNKLQVKWQGPFDIVGKVGRNDYTIDCGNGKRTYHANLLKKYYGRDESTALINELAGISICASTAVVHEEPDPLADVEDLHLEYPNFIQLETYKDTHVNQELSEEQRHQLVDVLEQFQDVLTDIPGRTDAYEYTLRLTSNTPIRKKPYPVPQAMKETLRKEVTSMLDSGVIEPSDSPYCSPSVVVKKKDGTNRYCVDYRALNNITVFDAEPMPSLDDLFQQVGPDCAYFSKIDLSKGYWQIPLSSSSKPMTAFATELGLMQFTVLPFGLQCAPAAFSRLMRKILHDLPNVKNYIDDILIHNSSWDEHLNDIKVVFQRLREAKLTARPTKCHLGHFKVEFLGHRLGKGEIAPLDDKVSAIVSAKPPQNKKQLRSFMGLASFYRRYIPNFAAISSPLTDATKKGMPERIKWETPQQRAFDHIKRILTSEPVLRLPDFERKFILATDASDTGIGGVLFQEYDNERFPVVFLSRKLLPREQRYSVVERECLALVWAVQKLNLYLLGREFVVETDHAPLLHLNKAKSENGRLMRWSLILSQFRFTLKAIKGDENHGPDLLSRL